VTHLLARHIVAEDLRLNESRKGHCLDAQALTMRIRLIEYME